VQLKLKLLDKRDLSECLLKSLHPIAVLDQLSPKALERAFVYWRDLVPLADRFKDEFGKYGVVPGQIGYADLIELRIFTEEEFDSRLKNLGEELADSAHGDWIDYRGFIKGKDLNETYSRAYLLSFLVSDGKATIRVDPLTEQITLRNLGRKATGEGKSLAISIQGEQ
jgi:hypothetical protein